MNPHFNQIDGRKYTVTATGIEFHSELTFDEWDELGRELAPIGRSIGFMLGDWINFGSKSHGEKYREALQSTGIAYQTLANYASVARKVSPSVREPALGFEHHAVIAKLEPSEQKYWLGLAKEQKLGVIRLRKSVQAGRVLTVEEIASDPSDQGVKTHLVLISGLSRWWKNQTSECPVEKWDKNWRARVKEDFRRLLNIYDQL